MGEEEYRVSLYRRGKGERERVKKRYRRFRLGDWQLGEFHGGTMFSQVVFLRSISRLFATNRVERKFSSRPEAILKRRQTCARGRSRICSQ